MNTFIRRGYLLSLMPAAISSLGKPRLSEEWRQIAMATDGIVGAAALGLSSGVFTSLNGEQAFPLASVCKIPIAMNVLALVDSGKFTLNQMIEVLPRDVWSGVSEIETRWPAQTRFPLEQLLRVMVAASDNTAVETLFRIGGGSPGLTTRFQEWKISGIRVDRSERQCSLDRNGVVHYPPPSKWTDNLLNKLTDEVPEPVRYRATLRYLADPRDTGTPNGILHLLASLFRGELLSQRSTDFLIETLKSTTTFPTRLKGLLPTGIVVAHKTGSTGTVGGITAATNDSGVVFLPNGGQLVLSVCVKASTRNGAERDRVIARIARAAYESVSSHTPG